MATKRKPKKVTSKRSTLTLRLQPAETTLIETLKKQTGQKTGSGALLFAASMYGKHMSEIQELYKGITTLKQQVQKSESILHLLRTSYRMLEEYGKKFLTKFPEPELQLYRDND